MLRLIARLATGLATLLLAVQASATVISYETTNVTGNTWRYDYSVTNDTLADPLNELTLYFQLGSFENLQSLGAPANWIGLLAQPDPLLPDNGFVDFLALGSGVGAGQTLSGFSVQFDWLAAGTPGSQPFDIIEPTAFEVIDSGVTTPGTPPAHGVPEPSSLALSILMAPLLFLARYRRPRERASALTSTAASIG